MNYIASFFWYQKSASFGIRNLGSDSDIHDIVNGRYERPYMWSMVSTIRRWVLPFTVSFRTLLRFRQTKCHCEDFKRSSTGPGLFPFVGTEGWNPTAEMVPADGTYLRSCMIRLYHKDKEGALHSPQNFELSACILHEFSRGRRSISTRFFSSQNLKRLRKQMGLRTASEVDLVVEFPWDASPRSMMAIVAKANDMELRRRVLVRAVDRLLRTVSLSKVLAVKGLRSCIIRENAYLGPGHAPYENFIESLLRITDTNCPGGEKLLELFLDSAADEADGTAFTSVEERGVRTVFHGTNHAVMDAILNSGLDPNLRRLTLKEDYFGVDYNTSLGYTKSKTETSYSRIRYKLLVFMIIVKSGGSLVSPGVVTVETNRLQLPLAEITL